MLRFLIILLLCLPLVAADIEGEVRIGTARHLVTPQGNLSVWFRGYEPLTERIEMQLGDDSYQMLPLQSVDLGTMRFTLLGAGGSRIDSMIATFVVSGVDAFSCVRRCENNAFISIWRSLDSDFSLCYQDCEVGCDLFYERVCHEGRGELVDNCGRVLTTYERCPLVTCPTCVGDDQCLTDTECDGRRRCVSGQCSPSSYRIGDGLCSLPDEPCSSEDCSCQRAPRVQATQSPVILLHGFASSPVRLRKLQRALVSRLGYADGGEISIFDAECQTNEERSVFLATYYANQDRGNTEEGALRDFIINTYKKIGGFVEEEDPDFLLTMDKVVAKVRSCTDSDQVSVIAHSMGGLVVRNYISQDSNAARFDKVILLGTPWLGGIYGEQTYQLVRGLEAPLGDRKTLLRDCAEIGIPSIALTLLDGRDYTADCQELATAGQLADSRLSVDTTPGLIEFYTIAGKIDAVGDGMVEVSGVQLPGAVANTVVPCDHFDLKHPGRCPDVLVAIAEAVGMQEEEIERLGIIGSLGEAFLSLRDWVVAVFA